MPEYKRYNTGAAALAIWQIEENEEQLKAYIGGDSFPVLAKFQDPNRRLEWLATRCLQKVLGITDHIIYAPNRRPYLSQGVPHISISHSFPLVCLIASPDFYVGVDIESTSRAYPLIADKYLTLGERAWVDINNPKLMAIIWSAKEALYKIPGMEGVNSFVDMNVMPMKEIGEQGRLQVRIRLHGLVQSFNLEYAFLNDYVITWVACNPKMMAQGNNSEPVG